MLENMIDKIRIALYATLIVLAFFLFQAWEQDHPVTAVTTESNQATHFIPDTSATPAIQAPATTSTSTTMPAVAEPTSTPVVPSQLVNVSTDTLDVTIDTKGGDIIAAKLLQYPESMGSKVPYTLLNNETKTRYLAESGLISELGPDNKSGQATYQVEQTNYQLAPGQNQVAVDLKWQKGEVFVVKRYIFQRNSYEIKVAYDIENRSAQPWEGNFYTQLLRTDSPPENQNGLINLTTFYGAAISTTQKPFEKLTFKDLQEKRVNVPSPDGWAAMVQHYFISAWVPPAKIPFTYYSNVTPNGLYTIGAISPKLVVPAGGKLSTEAKLYTGPTIASELEKTSSTLKLTIDYGWFWFISVIIFWMMQKIYEVVGNWGWSIVIVTIIIKLLFYQLSAKSYRSMSMLKKLQPRIEILKERYGDDKQKMTQATLELYRQEKVNPMSGCLPILIQIPVFIALYWVLVESVQLRQAPFILWIHDLSQKDPYYILPILMGISMFIQQRLNPPPADPMQAKVMMAMPLIFTLLFKDFPAGLMLYWFVNNTLSFLQQWYVMRGIDKPTHGKA